MIEALADQPRVATGSPRIAQHEVGNLLLRTMAAEDYARLEPHLRRVPMANGALIAKHGTLIDEVCFPERGIAGFLDVLEDGRRVAVGLLGREGFAGWPALMGNDRWPHEVVARGPDATALAIDLAALRSVLDTCERLRQLLLRYASSFIAQMTGTIASNLIQSVEQRTARWILMYHDRIDSDELVITHEELGAMLGVRRASITDALHQLEGCGSIRSRRGRLEVCSRADLIALAGDAYGRAESEYDRLLSLVQPCTVAAGTAVRPDPAPSNLR